ncbi:hypothetical protein LINPERHAP2_LOCUS21231 [Linum perenne]
MISCAVVACRPLVEFLELH